VEAEKAAKGSVIGNAEGGESGEAHCSKENKINEDNTNKIKTKPIKKQ
jgi:hypothetical protein